MRIKLLVHQLAAADLVHREVARPPAQGHSTPVGREGHVREAADGAKGGDFLGLAKIPNPRLPGDWFVVTAAAAGRQELIVGEERKRPNVEGVGPGRFSRRARLCQRGEDPCTDHERVSQHRNFLRKKIPKYIGTSLEARSGRDGSFRFRRQNPPESCRSIAAGSHEGFSVGREADAKHPPRLTVVSAQEIAGRRVPQFYHAVFPSGGQQLAVGRKDGFKDDAFVRRERVQHAAGFRVAETANVLAGAGGEELAVG